MRHNFVLAQTNKLYRTVCGQVTDQLFIPEDNKDQEACQACYPSPRRKPDELGSCIKCEQPSNFRQPHDNKMYSFCSKECFDAFLSDKKEERDRAVEAYQKMKQDKSPSDFDAKLVFVRDLGRLHYTERKFDIPSFLKLPDTVTEMTRDQIHEHLAGLEQAIRLLKTYSFGHNMAYREEEEPRIKERNESKQKEKQERQKKELKTVDEVVDKYKLDLNTLLDQIIAKRLKEQENK